MVEVAHDMQLQVGRYISLELNLLNSYDTWHGKMCLEQSLSSWVQTADEDYSREAERLWSHYFWFYPFDLISSCSYKEKGDTDMQKYKLTELVDNRKHFRFFVIPGR